MGSPSSPEICVEHKTTTIVKKAQWLRAAILGASDGLLSTASLMMGIGAAKQDQPSMVLSGIAGALAGGFSMAVGEFVSVSTQRDIEQSVSSSQGSGDISVMPQVQKFNPAKGSNETSQVDANTSEVDANTFAVLIEMSNRVSPECELSPTVVSPGGSEYIIWPSKSPMMRVIMGDPRGLTNIMPNPYKAGAASGLAFLCGSLVPLVPAFVIAQHTTRIIVIVVVTSISLALTGGIAASFGGSSVIMSATRVLLGGLMSMATTYGLLKCFT